MELLRLALLGYKVFLDNLAISLLELLTLREPKLVRLKWELFKSYVLRPPRWAHKLEGLEGDSLTYGETPFLTIHHILSWSGYTPADLFVDLGCGTGKPVFYVGYVLGGRAIGVDVVRRFVAQGKRIARSLKVEDKVLFFNEDVVNFSKRLPELRRQEELSGGRLYLYLPATAYPRDMLNSLEDSLRDTIEKEETMLITVTKTLQRLTDLLHLVSSVELPFSWGKATVHLYVRRLT